MKLADALGVEVADLFPKEQASLFTELPEQASPEQRREPPYWMADAFARQIDRLEELIVEQERRSTAGFSRSLAYSCLWAAEAIQRTHEEAEFEADSAERLAVMYRLDLLAERARRIYEKFEPAEEEVREKELREYRTRDSA
jgi:hypothetical protein